MLVKKGGGKVIGMRNVDMLGLLIIQFFTSMKNSSFNIGSKTTFCYL